MATVGWSAGPQAAPHICAAHAQQLCSFAAQGGLSWQSRKAGRAWSCTQIAHSRSSEQRACASTMWRGSCCGLLVVLRCALWTWRGGCGPRFAVGLRPTLLWVVDPHKDKVSQSPPFGFDIDSLRCALARSALLAPLCAFSGSLRRRFIST